MRIPKRSRSRGGFTLIELMIVVALIGALAAIAIPMFFTYQARSRRAEGYTNLSSLGRAYIAFYAESGEFPDMLALSGEPSLPDPADYIGLGTVKMPWDGQTESFFNTVGWKAEGQVFYTYDVNSERGCSCTSCFTASVHGDVDGDGAVSTLMFVHPQRAGDGTLMGSCPDGIFGYGPPIDPVTGVEVYDAVAIRADLDQY